MPAGFIAFPRDPITHESVGSARLFLQDAPKTVSSTDASRSASTVSKVSGASTTSSRASGKSFKNFWTRRTSH